jgi:CheY-like chemotaxis protein
MQDLSPPMPQAPRPAPVKVVIIDDDPDFREFVRIVLERHGYEVYEADDASAGLALMREVTPDLALLDAMMSYELAGVGAIRAVRSDPKLQSTPLILISAVLSEDEDRFLPQDERSMVNRFLSKPISPDELLAAVAGLVAPHAPQ